jgi:hypothetical protein
LQSEYRYVSSYGGLRHISLFVASFVAQVERAVLQRAPPNAPQKSASEEKENDVPTL